MNTIEKAYLELFIAFLDSEQGVNEETWQKACALRNDPTQEGNFAHSLGTLLYMADCTDGCYYLGHEAAVQYVGQLRAGRLITVRRNGAE